MAEPPASGLPQSIYDALDESKIDHGAFHAKLLPALVQTLKEHIPSASRELQCTLLRRSLPFVGFPHLADVPIAVLNAIGDADLPADILQELADSADSEPLFSLLPSTVRPKLYTLNPTLFEKDVSTLLDAFERDAQGLAMLDHEDDAAVESLPSFAALVHAIQEDQVLFSTLADMLRIRFKETGSTLLCYLRYKLLSRYPGEPGSGFSPQQDDYLPLAHILKDSIHQGALDVARTRSFFDSVPKDVASYSQAGMLFLAPPALNCLVKHYIKLVTSAEAVPKSAAGDDEYLTVLMRVALKSRDFLMTNKLVVGKWQFESAVKTLLKIYPKSAPLPNELDMDFHATLAEIKSAIDAANKEPLSRWIVGVFCCDRKREGVEVPLEVLRRASPVFERLHETLESENDQDVKLLAWIQGSA